MFASQPGGQSAKSSPSSSSWWSSVGGWVLGRGGGAAARGGGSVSAEERYQQALATAKVFVDDSNARVARLMDKHNAVANSSYWFYGYFGANMMTAVALCLVAGNRIALLRRYSGWCGLAWGYFGGTACHNIHKSYLLADVVAQVDREVAEARQRDEQTGRLVPDYMREVHRLEALKAEVTAHLRSRKAAGGDAAQQQAGDEAYSPDVQAEELVSSYMRRREALGRKH